MYPRAGAVFSEGSNDRATGYRPDADRHHHPPHGGGGPPAHHHDSFYYAAGSRHHFRQDGAHLRMFVLFKLSSGICVRGRTSMMSRILLGFCSPIPLSAFWSDSQSATSILHLHLGTPTVPYPHQVQTSFEYPPIQDLQAFFSGLHSDNNATRILIAPI